MDFADPSLDPPPPPPNFVRETSYVKGAPPVLGPPVPGKKKM